MADHIVLPPIPCCSCWLCAVRRQELALTAQMEREMLGTAYREAVEAGIEWRVQLELRAMA